MPDPYELLGVSHTATQDEVKRAYRKACLRHHPDLSPPAQRAEAEASFKQVSEAYNLLSKGGPSRGQEGHAFGNRQRATWTSSQARRFFNRGLAIIICVPLVLTGIRIGMAYPKFTSEAWRGHGLMNPPVNPFLKDESAAATSIVKEIDLTKDGKESIYDVKAKIATAFGSKMSPDQLLLYFGPNERRMGKQFLNDPTVDEKELLLHQYSCLSWLERFPHWHLSVRLMPATPPPPGVATVRAAALSEGKDPDKAVKEGRTKGEIPNITDLPAPWGPKPYTAPPPGSDALLAYQPPNYPATSSPAINELVAA
ncbi:hypothetical protein WJX72_008336 [[Myrmecia] bisecta]|uniref:J domain-containing protein n=1 Tax=[Myrmecia] bisecta TaxID=41462 RepID=A0AAW1QSV1_9CHLO